MFLNGDNDSFFTQYLFVISSTSERKSTNLRIKFLCYQLLYNIRKIKIWKPLNFSVLSVSLYNGSSIVSRFKRNITMELFRHSITRFRLSVTIKQYISRRKQKSFLHIPSFSLVAVSHIAQTLQHFSQNPKLSS